jgi:hypothetical protein
VVLTAGALGGGGWELRCEHNIAIIFSCRSFLIDSADGRAEGGGVGYPGESIIRKSSALTRLECKVFGKDGADEDEFVSDMRNGLPLLPSSSDEVVSIRFKALIVNFCIYCWTGFEETKPAIVVQYEGVESPNQEVP